MKTLLKFSMILFLAVFLVSGSAMAGPIFGDGGAALQDVFDDIAVDGINDVKAATDFIDDSFDSAWALTASGGSVATMIIEIADFAPSNKFGVYDSTNPAKIVQLFAGSNVAGDQVTVSLKLDGSVFLNGGDTGVDFSGNSFGYWLDATVGNINSDAFFYSDTSLNIDGFDHMGAYQGVDELVQLPGYFPGKWTDNEWILAWEDLYNGGDKDFTDFVLMVESVQPIPEPATMLLSGLGLLGLGVYLRRRSKKA